MEKCLMTGNHAAAWGARLAGAEYIPAFPITPQTEIIEALSDWIGKGEMDARMVMMESEHAMMTAAGAAAAAGVRVFTATSSQGLLYAMEMLYTIPGWRVPLVLVNVSRGLASPITLEPDHNDVLAARDSGVLQLHAASCQEVLDTVLIAFRLGEDARVRLPVLVNLDGFYLSFTREPLHIPDRKEVQGFLGAYDSRDGFRADRPAAAAVAVLGGGSYSYFRYEAHLAAQNALTVYDEVVEEYSNRFGRHLDAVESYRMEGAEMAIFMMGAFSSKAREAVDRAREAGVPLGLLRPRLLRPFPRQALREAASGVSALAVVDQNLSPGYGGILYGEVAQALYGAQAPLLASYIGGLGGRDITTEEFFQMTKELKVALEVGSPPPPRLLFTEEELVQVRALQQAAGVEQLEQNWMIWTESAFPTAS